jgi:hypothetical protein
VKVGTARINVRMLQAVMAVMAVMAMKANRVLLSNVKGVAEETQCPAMHCAGNVQWTDHWKSLGRAKQTAVGGDAANVPKSSAVKIVVISMKNAVVIVEMRRRRWMSTRGMFAALKQNASDGGESSWSLLRSPPRSTPHKNQVRKFPPGRSRTRTSRSTTTTTHLRPAQLPLELQHSLSAFCSYRPDMPDMPEERPVGVHIYIVASVVTVKGERARGSCCAGWASLALRWGRLSSWARERAAES